MCTNCNNVAQFPPGGPATFLKVRFCRTISFISSYFVTLPRDTGRPTLCIQSVGFNERRKLGIFAYPDEGTTSYVPYISGDVGWRLCPVGWNFYSQTRRSIIPRRFRMRTAKLSQKLARNAILHRRVLSAYPKHNFPFICCVPVAQNSILLRRARFSAEKIILLNKSPFLRENIMFSN